MSKKRPRNEAWPTAILVTQFGEAAERDVMFNVIPSFDDRAGCRFLSNMFPAPFVLRPFGADVAPAMKWPTSEHYFAAMKSTDPREWERVRVARDGYAAKAAGRSLKLREDWADVRVDVMLAALRAKFGQNALLREQLLDTGSAILVEGNTWEDRLWGAVDGAGENLLGLCLMVVRAEIRSRNYKRRRNAG